MNDLLRERITMLGRGRRELGGEKALDPEKLAAFFRLMRGVLENADNPTCKAHLLSLLTVEVGPKMVRIISRHETLFPPPMLPLHEVK